MESLPDMWRTELWHPLSVHFPIALLIIAALILLLSKLPFFGQWKERLSFSGLILLVPGTLLAWWSVYTGTLADSVVGRHVCDPTVLEDHERFAYITAYIFTGLTILELLIRLGKNAILTRFKKYLTLVSIILMLAGVSSMGYVGHLGAKLVYQQGASVHQPSEDCSEFE